MSLNDTRAAFKEALDEVAGVTGYLRRPSTPKPGDAWPIWRGGERDQNTGLFDHTWAVGLMLPQDEKSAQDWIDARLDDLAKAIRPVAYVESVAPATFGGTDSSPVYGLLITTSTE